MVVNNQESANDIHRDDDMIENLAITVNHENSPNVRDEDDDLDSNISSEDESRWIDYEGIKYQRRITRILNYPRSNKPFYLIKFQDKSSISNAICNEEYSIMLPRLNPSRLRSLSKYLKYVKNYLKHGGCGSTSQLWRVRREMKHQYMILDKDIPNGTNVLTIRVDSF
jgi:hypothetical protein